MTETEKGEKVVLVDPSQAPGHLTAVEGRAKIAVFSLQEAQDGEREWGVYGVVMAL